MWPPATPAEPTELLSSSRDLSLTEAADGGGNFGGNYSLPPLGIRSIYGTLDTVVAADGATRLPKTLKINLKANVDAGSLQNRLAWICGVSYHDCNLCLSRGCLAVAGACWNFQNSSRGSRVHGWRLLEVF